MTVSGLWWGAWSTEAVRWVRATWELLPTAHLDGLCVRKRAKKVKLGQFFSFFSPPTRYITLEHHWLYSRLDVVVWNVFFTFASFSLLCLSKLTTPVISKQTCPTLSLSYWIVSICMTHPLRPYLCRLFSVRAPEDRSNLRARAP